MSKAIPVAKDMSPQRLIVKNILSLGGSAVLERMLALTAGIFARRALGPGPTGLVSWATAIGSYPALLVNGGFGTIAKRDVARDPQRANQLTGLVLTLQFALALVASSIVIGLAVSMDRSSDTKLLVALQAIGLLMLPLDLTWLLHSREHMAPLAMVTIIAACVRTLFTIVVIREPSDVFSYAVLVYPFQAALNVFQITYAAKHSLVSWRLVRPTLHGAKRLLKESWPIGLTSGAILLYYNSDTLILGATRSAQEVGLYTTAYSLMVTPMILTGSLSSAFFPSLARVSSNAAEAYRVSSLFLRVLLWVGVPIAAMGWAVGRYPVNVLYGRDFAPAGVYFEWLCLNVALIFFNVGYSTPLQAWGGQRELFFCTLLAGIANLGANLFLLPRFGIPAAITTTIVSEIIVMSLVIFVRRNYYPINWMTPAIKVLIVCVTAAAAARLLADRGLWFLGLVTGCIIIALGVSCCDRSLLMIVKRIIVRQELS